ncbi:NADPH azoreductase [Legionella massiliensis]|uniref:NADPH azoreductase n=1 Tax=Legionella massiliensis TaxID=1034943 RepID=A0A078L4Z8_9GAMM|nr:NAD(P)H-dependent oxidoreductase [Legionella massiliensis]CDZ78983.1 NADPH azoreductase [Legionella massiliensis]CEE14721.1 NADPH azoreductase [Legionella massiliensis]
MSQKIGLFVGSLRKAAWTRKLAKSLIELAPAPLQLEIIEIGQLPLYNQDPDDEGKPHQEWVDFRDKVKTLDGFIFVTPEYNRSIPAALKNALDVGSRPYGKSVWGGKPAAVLSSSIGAIGGFGANQHLRQTFVFLDIFCMQQPEAYISAVDKLFDQDGNLLNGGGRDFLKLFVDSYANWIKRFQTQ